MVRRTASSAARILAGVSLISVGTNSLFQLPVSRNDCAETLRVGSSLNKTPPPPFTWTSINPGASHATFRQGPDGHRYPASSRPYSCAMPQMHGPSITTAHSWCKAVPWKKWYWLIPRRVGPIYSSGPSDLAEMPGLVDISTKATPPDDGHHIEALDEADGVGFGVIAGKHGQAPGPAPGSATNSAVPFW